jgi:hypothetical protein
MANTNLTDQRQVFVEEYVRSGDHLEAAKKAGYKDTHTLRNQACKLRRECADQITDELHRNFAEIAPRALNILSDLAENAESESVRLGATRDLLDRAGFRPVDRHLINETEGCLQRLTEIKYFLLTIFNFTTILFVLSKSAVMKLLA